MIIDATKFWTILLPIEISRLTNLNKDILLFNRFKDETEFNRTIKELINVLSKLTPTIITTSNQETIDKYLSVYNNVIVLSNKITKDEKGNEVNTLILIDFQ